jgi:hypothetical protein
MQAERRGGKPNRARGGLNNSRVQRYRGKKHSGRGYGFLNKIYTPWIYMKLDLPLPRRTNQYNYLGCNSIQPIRHKNNATNQKEQLILSNPKKR